MNTSIYPLIYACVKNIPSGNVATYGQIAKLVHASGPRQVGYALSSTPDDLKIPWHRVINAKGELSVRSDGEASNEQRQRLLAEGVVPNTSGKIDLQRYRWQPLPGDIAGDEMCEDLPGFG